MRKKHVFSIITVISGILLSTTISATSTKDQNNDSKSINNTKKELKKSNNLPPNKNKLKLPGTPTDNPSPNNQPKGNK